MSQAISLKKRDIQTPEKCGKYVISVIGCGRLGLATACLFAEAGFNVIVVDVNHRDINQSELDALINKHGKNGRLKIINDASEAASASDVIVFIIPTPVDRKKKPNYSRVQKVGKELGLGIRSGSLIIVESTTGPGITESLIKEVLEDASGLKAGVDFGLAYSPIRTFSGRVLQDIATYPRVLGAINNQSLTVARLVLTKIRGMIENAGFTKN